MKLATWTSPVLHADLDAFYASVEVLRDPSLKGRPVIVGGTSTRGVVTSASYEARRSGVRSAMPTSRARRLCPTAVFIQPDFTSYMHYSSQVREVFESFSPVVEPISLDEAFIDLKGASRMWPNPPTVAEALRDRVKRNTGLTVSVGVAPNKFLSKLASRRAKPDGIVVVDAAKVNDFLHPLDVGELWGVGDQTVTVLKRLGLNTIGDVAGVPRSTLERALGSLGAHLADLALGKDDRPIVKDAQRKSIGAEETFEHDLADESQMLQALLKLSDRVSSRLRGQGISGQTVTLKIRFMNFSTITRSKTLPHEIDSVNGVYGVAGGLLAKHMKDVPAGRKRIRLLGVSISNLAVWPASEQLTFDRRPRWVEADRALDKVRLRFGDEALGFAALLDDE
ncbi:MAG: DNA polymerase IV [Actinomycetota bacterium]|nr:DNA polymerase IV [Actinomycetota bacterium]